MTANALIIDDNPSNVDALQALLTLQNVAALSANTPREVDSALASAGEIHLVFLDIEFPNDNGLDALQTLRAHPRLQRARFVAYTVHTSEQNEALTAGFDSFIGKPLNVDHFPDQLQRILAGESVWEI